MARETAGVGLRCGAEFRPPFGAPHWQGLQGVSVSKRWAIADSPSRHFKVPRMALFALVLVKVTATTTVRPARAAASAPVTVLRHCGSDADAARIDTKVL